MIMSHLLEEEEGLLRKRLQKENICRVLNLPFFLLTKRLTDGDLIKRLGREQLSNVKRIRSIEQEGPIIQNDSCKKRLTLKQIQFIPSLPPASDHHPSQF